MTRRDHMDPDLSRALEHEFEGRVARGTRAPGRGLSVPWQAVIAVAVAALVIGASIAALLIAVPRAAPTDRSAPAPSITVGDKILVRVGTFPWADAVWQDAAHTTLTVYADLDDIHVLPNAFSCDATIARVRVLASASSLRVVLDAYYPPPPSPETFCAGVGLGSEALTVHLNGTLGGRALVDGATGRRHAVFDPALIPTPTALPTGFLLRRTTWDEKSGVAARIWATDTAKKGSYQDYSVTVVPRDIAPVTFEERDLGATSVHDRPARITLSAGPYDWRESITWTAADGRSLVLTSHGNVHDHRPLAEIERVAQSVPDP